MELESSSPYPQEPATCPYPEPTPSSPHNPLQLPEDPSFPLQSITISIKLAYVHLERDKKVSTLKGLRLEVESTCNGWCSRDTAHNLAHTLSDSKTNVMLVTMTFCLNHGKES
jgi:hypothetical protein